ncbi:MAG: MBL fold metallo-hydrolase [Rudaea sp.]
MTNNYNVRDDRFSLLEPVTLAGTLDDYTHPVFGGRTYSVYPTPGHTVGSLSLLAEIDGRRVAFTGDLIAEGGRVHSPGSLQWTYTVMAGAAANMVSLHGLAAQHAQLLLPSHGEPIGEPERDIKRLADRLWGVLQARGESTRLLSWLEQPYQRLSPHLLLNRTSVSNSYVLLSECGDALLIDFGYDMMTGFAAGFDRASRRPWLYTLDALKKDYGVRRIDVALATHYHDDHVAGFNLLREIEGTQIWAAEKYAGIMEHPANYDLPCLWFEPIRVDRALPFERPVRWNEYEFRLYPLPGHAQHAAAVSFEVDGRRVLATGDQYKEDTADELNYVLKNGFGPGDYRFSAQLLAALAPDLILSGHWAPLAPGPGYYDRLLERGESLQKQYAELGLPDGAVEVSLTPYQVAAPSGECIDMQVVLQNRSKHGATVRIELVVPRGWNVLPRHAEQDLASGESCLVDLSVMPGPAAVRRARVAADVTLNGKRLGQIAEALVTVEAELPGAGSV